MLTDICELPDELLSGSDGIEVHPVEEYRDSDGEKICQMIGEEEIGRDQTANYFWSVYLHQKTGGVYCIADFYTEQEALKYALIVGALLQNQSDQTV